jgi:hypothetical protein
MRAGENELYTRFAVEVKKDSDLKASEEEQ